MSMEARHRDGKLGCAEYPCVRRFRHRRLLAFLWLQGFEDTVESMLSESDTVFGVLRLRDFVERGQWGDALNYLSRFVPASDAKRKRPLSVEAEVLYRFLGMQMNLAGIVAGTKESPFYSQYLSHDKTVCQGTFRLRSIILNIHYARQQLRTSIDWERVRYKAGEIVQDLACRTLELKDRVYVPGILVEPHNVLPIGFGFISAGGVTQRNEHAGQEHLLLPSSIYLEQRRSPPATSGPSQESCSDMSESKALNWVADIVDECLKAGKRPEYHQAHPLQTSGTEGVTVAPFSQTMFNKLYPATNHGMPTVAATEGKLASHVPTNGAPIPGTVQAPILRTAYVNLTSHCGSSGAGSMANTGATVAPVSQPVFSGLTCPSINPGMPSVAAEGATAVPVSQTMFGSLSCPPINPRMPSTANAGAPVASVSQMMGLTSHAGDSGSGH